MDGPGMERTLAATRGALARAWVAWIAHLRDENPPALIEERRMVGPLDVVHGIEAAAASFAAAETAAYAAAAQSTARWMADQIGKRHTPVRKKLLHYDPAELPALRWAEQNRLDTIREITGETREMVRQALINGVRSGANPRDIAQVIHDSIGLTAKQVEIVENYRRQLQSGDLAAALQRELSSGASDRAIGAAMRNKTPLTPAQIDTAVERYRENFRRLRAETIARTESQRVAHQGSEELYRQAIARDDIAAEQIERTWVHSPRRADKRHEREFHRSMHGQVRAWGEPFVSGLGNLLRFPGDPEAPPVETLNCACAVSTRIRPAPLANAA